MYYIFVFILLVVLELCYFKIADHYNIIDKPNSRSSHSRITLRGGGIIFYLGALTWFLTNQFEYPWFIFGLTLIAGISFVDDVRSISSRLRLIVHFVAMLCMFWQWGMGAMSWWYFPIALVVCTGIINAYNFMDGINGITGGYSFIILALLAYINVFVVSYTNSDLLRIMLLAVTVFNFFNFRKQAKCFAGDVGAVSIAFIILFLLGQLILHTEDIGYIIFLAVYGIDSILTIIHRIMLHENIGVAHRKHLYQIMANELKIPHIKVAGLYMILQGLIAVGYLSFYEYRWWYFGIVIVLLCTVYCWFMKKYFHLHREAMMKA